MDEQISTLEGQIEDKNNEIDQLEGNIDQLEEDIAAKQVEIDDTYEIFKTRMVALYQAGETSSLAMLLSSDSFSDFVTNIQLMQAVSKSDEELVDTLRSQKEEQEVQKQAVEEYKVEVETALEEIKADEEAIILQREEQRIAQSNLEVAYSESETAQEDLEALQAQYENDLEGMLAEEAAVEAELQDFYAEQARQQAAAQQNNSSSSSGSSSNVIADTGDLSFRWPLPGYSYISSPFGSRWGGWHTGIDISGGGVYGASIVAAESGTVIMAQWYSTYGNCVIVDHGGGYSTLYAHMSQIGCNVGDYVTKGQTVGYVGSTGNSTGPHLHFEVRVNGTAQNPQNYVSA
ncbi:MAG TPA: peptidoglycan DD-metalloendopeptidase family protein [Candidatus Faecivivens stercoravium]|uniref:Peptidoglycan DD-metalloendopeptidase family protein n=1 Tax=Candidatus Faecivivens stercoravium TaxID=2840803 RepID=A0A9D1J4Q5_9FIRM|nr:peptidoglycan DD-metalloendopeptidase family protein [Candidatus Faecivivens stercoravium]